MSEGQDLSKLDLALGLAVDAAEQCEEEIWEVSQKVSMLEFRVLSPLGERAKALADDLAQFQTAWRHDHRISGVDILGQGQQTTSEEV